MNTREQTEPREQPREGQRLTHYDRPVRPIDVSGDSIQGFALGDLAEELKGERTYADHGSAALTLVHRKDLTAVLSVSAAGRTMEERLAPGPRLVQTIRGSISIRGAGGEPVTIPEGDVVALGPDAPAEIHAETDCAVLIVIGAQS